MENTTKKLTDLQRTEWMIATAHKVCSYCNKEIIENNYYVVDNDNEQYNTCRDCYNELTWNNKDEIYFITRDFKNCKSTHTLLDRNN